MAWPDSRVLLAGWEKFGDDVWPMLRGPFAAAIWDPRDRALTLARDHLGLNVVMWHRSERFFAFATMPNGLFALADVPRELSEEKFADFLVLNHADHATTIYRNMFRVPPGARHAGRSRRFDHAAPLLVAGRDQAGQACFRSGLCRRLARHVSIARCAGRCAARIRSAACSAAGSDSSSVSVLAARALGEKNQRLAAFTGVPRPASTARCRQATTPTKPLTSMRLRRTPAISTSPMSATTSATISPSSSVSFVALEGPVRNPTNLGWVLAMLRLRARKAGACCSAASMAIPPSAGTAGRRRLAHLKRGRLLTALRQWQLYYRRTPYSRWVALRKLLLEPLVPERLAHWADRRRASPVAPGRITPQSAPTSPPQWRSMPRAEKSDTTFSIACGRTNA